MPVLYGGQPGARSRYRPPPPPPDYQAGRSYDARTVAFHPQGAGPPDRVSSQQRPPNLPRGITARAHYNEMGERSLHVDWGIYENQEDDHRIKFKLRYRAYLDGTDEEWNEGLGWQEYALSRETPFSDGSDISHAVIPNVPWIPIPYEVQVQAIKIHETTAVEVASAWSGSGVQDVVLTVDDLTVLEGSARAEVRITAVPAMRSAGQVKVSAVALASDATDNAATIGRRCELGDTCPRLSEFNPRETDFVPNTATISFDIGDTSKTFALVLANDQIAESPEKFHINLESLDTSNRITLVQKQEGSDSVNYESYADARYERQITVTIQDDDVDTPPSLGGPDALPDQVVFVGERASVELPRAVENSGNGTLTYTLVNAADRTPFEDVNGLSFVVVISSDTSSLGEPIPGITGTPMAAATHEVIYQVHDADDSLDEGDCDCRSLRIKALPGHLEVTGSNPGSDAPDPYEINLSRGAPFPCDEGQCRPWTVVKHISGPTRYSISVDQPWLRATPGSEGLLAGSEKPVELALTPAADDLALGVHEATLTFTEHFEGITNNIPFSRDLVVGTRTVRADVQDDRPPTVPDIPDYSFPVVNGGPTEFITLPAAEAGSGNGGPYSYEVLLEDDSGGVTPITEAGPTISVVIFYPDDSRLGISPQFGGEIYNLVYRVHDGDDNRQDSDAADVRFRISMPLNSAPQFASAPANLTFAVGQTVDETLPMAADGSGDGGPYSYSLTYRNGSAFPDANSLGLTFDAATRRLSGTVTGEGALQVTYRVHDNDRWLADFDSTTANFDIVVTSATVSIAPVTPSITEGGQAEFLLTASPAPASNLTVNLNITQSGDFAAAAATGAATIQAGNATTTHRVATVNDNAEEANGSVTAAFTGAAGSYAVGTPNSATVTVNDDDAIVRVVSIAPGSVAITEGGYAEFLLTASPAPASDLTVNLNITQSGDFAAAAATGAATATIQAGNATTTHRVATINDNAEEANGSVTAAITGASGSYGVGTPRSATVTVNDDDTIVRVVSIAPVTPSITEGGYAEFVLTASPAPASNLTVNLNVTQSGDFAAATGAATAIIQAGNATTTHRVATVNDNAEEANGSVTAAITGASGGYAVGTPNSATVTVNDDDTIVRVVSIAPGSVAITEGGYAEFLLTASPAPASDLTVNLNVTQSGDFAAATGAATAIIQAGNATTTHRVATVNDNADEGNGSVTAAITGASGSYGVGTPRSATVNVADNDDTALPKVTDLRVTGAAGSLQLSWRAVSDASGYKVQWKSDGESYSMDREVVTSTEYTISGLTADEIYTVQVAATKFGASGPWSEEKRGIPTQSCTRNEQIKTNAGPDVWVVPGGYVILDGSCSADSSSNFFWSLDEGGPVYSTGGLTGKKLGVWAFSSSSGSDHVPGHQICFTLYSTYGDERSGDDACLTVR